MLNFVKKAWAPLVALALCCACSSESETIVAAQTAQTAETAEVTVSVFSESWNDGTRVGGAGLSPVTLLVVPDGEDRIAKRITVAEGSFNVRLADGAYDLVAVCGLEADLIGENLSDAVAVPAGTDFAVGTTRVTVSKGVCSPSAVSILAERQMSWLDVSITGVPENIAKLELFVKEPCDEFALDRKWQLSQSGVNTYAKIALTKGADGYSGGGIMAPCANVSGVTYVAEATTTGGIKTTLTYTSSKALSAGVHLIQTLSYGDLMIVEGGINVGDWTNETDDGTLTVEDGTNGNGNGTGGNGSGDGTASFVPGEALPGYDGTTVVSVDGSKVTFVANAPLEGNASYFQGLLSKGNYTSFSSPIPADRWFVLQGKLQEDKDMAQLFLDLILSSESARTRLEISLSDTNVFAYCNVSSGISYYNFATGKIAVVSDNRKEFRCFVFGEMTVE